LIVAPLAPAPTAFKVPNGATPGLPAVAGAVANSVLEIEPPVVKLKNVGLTSTPPAPLRIVA